MTINKQILQTSGTYAELTELGGEKELQPGMIGFAEDQGQLLAKIAGIVRRNLNAIDPFTPGGLIVADTDGLTLTDSDGAIVITADLVEMDRRTRVDGYVDSSAGFRAEEGASGFIVGQGSTTGTPSITKSTLWGGSSLGLIVSSPLNTVAIYAPQVRLGLSSGSTPTTYLTLTDSALTLDGVPFVSNDGVETNSVMSIDTDDTLVLSTNSDGSAPKVLVEAAAVSLYGTSTGDPRIDVAADGSVKITASGNTIDITDSGILITTESGDYMKGGTMGTDFYVLANAETSIETSAAGSLRMYVGGLWYDVLYSSTGGGAP